jgi:hypothetical protein
VTALQANVHGESAFRWTLRAHGAAHGFDESLHEGETHPGAFGRSGAEGVFEPVESGLGLAIAKRGGEAISSTRAILRNGHDRRVGNDYAGLERQVVDI